MVTGWAVGRAGEAGAVGGARAGGWGGAVEGRGVAAVTAAGDGGVDSGWCGAGGRGAGGGLYSGNEQQGFVAVERNGRWGRAIEVPGLAALNTDGLAEVKSVSCGAAGSCAAGGGDHGGRRPLHGVAGLERERRRGPAHAGPRPAAP